MKVFAVILGLIALGAAAPQPRKVFHEHFNDFMHVIIEEVGHDLDHLMEHYFEYDEFRATLDYLKTANFKDLIYEMESLPEFKAVIDFLEGDNIDIHYFVDMLNDIIEQTVTKRGLRHETSGTDFHSFIQDSIALLPKEKLQALFEEKKAEDEEFKTAIENLYSDEWSQTFGALFESEDFIREISTLNENGINIYDLLGEIKAIFGQN